MTVHPFTNKCSGFLYACEGRPCSHSAGRLAAILRSRSPLPEICIVLCGVISVALLAFTVTFSRFSTGRLGIEAVIVDLWGVLLLSGDIGCFKLVYIFRHLLLNERARTIWP